MKPKQKPPAKTAGRSSSGPVAPSPTASAAPVAAAPVAPRHPSAAPAPARGAATPLPPAERRTVATPVPPVTRDSAVAAARLHEQLQLVFPFPSLDFPGRATLTVGEIAAKLGWTEKHILNLIGAGDLPCLNGKGREATRGSFRVPVECYRDFITARLTGSRRLELLCLLPKPTLRELVRELSAFLARG